MRVSVFGLGYVGSVSAACLAKEGHTVVGVDVIPLKVEMISHGHSPIIEQGLDTLTQAVVRDGRLTATQDAVEAIRESDISLVCVGTPSKPNGNLDTQYLVRSCEEIGTALRDSTRFHVVAVRSTVLPGTVARYLRPVLEQQSGKKAGREFGICINPEFLREGSSLNDFYDPPFTLIGADDERSGEMLEELFRFLSAPVVRTDVPTAEMLKYANNAFHSLKVTFANEIGNVCKACGIDSVALMSMFCRDTKLNVSAAYLRPGFAFGGSCLPKDLRAITYHARQRDVDTPVLDAILRSNELQIRKVVEFILQLRKSRVSLLGLSFKAGTDDLRESPMVALAESLFGKGLQLRIYDSNVHLARLVGSNKRFIEQELPHLSSVLCGSLEEALNWGDVIVIGGCTGELADLPRTLRDEQFVVDLVRAIDPGVMSQARYWGVCW